MLRSMSLAIEVPLQKREAQRRRDVVAFFLGRGGRGGQNLSRKPLFGACPCADENGAHIAFRKLVDTYCALRAKRNELARSLVLIHTCFRNSDMDASAT